jgi:TonB family protein
MAVASGLDRGSLPHYLQHNEAHRPIRIVRRAIIYMSVAMMLGCRESDAPLTLPQPMPGASPVTYPTDLWDLGVQGETMLMVLITEGGVVDSAYVLEPSGYAGFDSAAIRGALQLRFTPGRRGDRPIPLWTRLPIRFQRDSLDNGPPAPEAADSIGPGT